MRSIECGSIVAGSERRAGGGDGEVRGQLAGRGDPALANAGALGDPGIGGVDLLGEIGVGEDMARQIAPTAEHDRTRHRHVGTLSATGLPTAAFWLAEHLGNLRLQLVARHVVAEVDRRGEAFGIGAAMALDDDAVEAEKYAAVDLAWIHLVLQCRERVAGEQIAELGEQRPAHGVAQIFAKLFGGSFGSFQGDIAGKALGDHDVHGSLADVVALDEADIIEVGALRLAQDAAGLAHLLETLDLLDPDVEEADRRPLEIEQHPRHGAAHGGERDEVLGIAADGGADIEHDRFAAQSRPQRRDRRAGDAGHRLEVESRHRHQGAGIAGRDHRIGLALLHGVDRHPHRRFPPAMAQRLAGLLVHLDGDVGVDDPRGRLEGSGCAASSGAMMVRSPTRMNSVSG